MEDGVLRCRLVGTRLLACVAVKDVEDPAVAVLFEAFEAVGRHTGGQLELCASQGDEQGLPGSSVSGRLGAGAPNREATKDGHGGLTGGGSPLGEAGAQHPDGMHPDWGSVQLLDAGGSACAGKRGGSHTVGFDEREAVDWQGGGGKETRIRLPFQDRERGCWGARVARASQEAVNGKDPQGRFGWCGRGDALVAGAPSPLLAPAGLVVCAPRERSSFSCFCIAVGKSRGSGQLCPGCRLLGELLTRS